MTFKASTPSFAALALSLALVGVVQAKIPAPVLSPEAKAKAAEAAAKTAWTNKVTDFQLCRSMDKVAAKYLESATQRNATPAPVPVNTIVCTDPGPFVYVAPDPAAPAAAPAAAAAPAPAPAAAATAAADPAKK